MIPSPAQVRSWFLQMRQPIPDYVAADLLSQAEHDEMASAILITTSTELAKKVSIRDRRISEGVIQKRDYREIPGELMAIS